MAINKYGVENFEAELIEEFDSIDNWELLALETAYILYFNSINKETGYNVCLCARDRTGAKNSPEQIESHRQKLLGRKHSKEHCMAISRGNMGRTFSQEIRRKIGFAQIGAKNHLARKVIQIDKITNQPIKIWDTIIEPTRSLGLKSPFSIRAVCLGINKTAAGFHWQYA